MYQQHKICKLYIIVYGCCADRGTWSVYILYYDFASTDVVLY